MQLGWYIHTTYLGTWNTLSKCYYYIKTIFQQVKCEMEISFIAVLVLCDMFCGIP